MSQFATMSKPVARVGKSSPPLGTLWLGDHLPKMEVICLCSMVAMGWDITVFAYGPIENLPADIRLADARQICPENLSDADVFGDRARPPAMFADMFRLRMIAETGMIWVDTDLLVVAENFPSIRPALFSKMKKGGVNNAVLYIDPSLPMFDEYLAAVSEEYPSPKPYFRDVGNAELEARAAAGNPIHCAALEPRYFSGPTPLEHFLEKHDLLHHTLDPNVFYPIGYSSRKQLWRSDEHVQSRLTKDTCAVHLWGSFMRHWFEEQTPGPDTFFYHQIERIAVALQSRQEA